MSRTYRRTMLELDCNCGALIEPHFSWNKGKLTESVERAVKRANSWGLPPNRTCECETRYDYYSKRNWKRDRKNWFKSSSTFKKITKKSRKAKERSAMAKKYYEDVPRFRNSNDYDWN